MIQTIGSQPKEVALGDGGNGGREPTDEQLISELLSGRQEAMQELHRRHAPLVFHIACRSLDAPAAEEITQDVFLQVWQKAASFDPGRGAFRPWMLQIAHRRVLNELRHRGRRPRIVGVPEESGVELAAHDPGPEEQVWGEYRRSVIERALATLPKEQGRALRLAFFQDLTHEEVAHFLEVPLGTAKSRIRVALEKLNPRLAALVALLLAALGLSAFEWTMLKTARGRDQRALAMLTSSRMEALRLVPPAPSGEIEQGPHATYRAERGGSMVVFTLSHVPVPRSRETYRLWRLGEGRWEVLGDLEPDAQGRARLLIETDQAVWPEALKLTLETAGQPPVDPPFLVWPPRAPAPGQ
jgi:RNA polymerase sigma-70 factor, ECF subfamily